MIDGGACRRLTAFAQPQTRHHRGEVGTPYARHEGGLAGARHGAGRRAEDIGHSRLQRADRTLAADRADATGMSIEQPCGDRGPGREAELGGGTPGQPVGKRRAGLDRLGADPHKAFIGQSAEADRAKIRCVPAPLMAEIGPFAGQRADRPRQAAGRAPAQIVGQVEEMLGRGKCLGQVFLQPQEFRGLHLGRDRAAHIVQHAMLAGVDAPRLVEGAVVHPDDDVALAVARPANRQWRAALPDHDQRAGRIEADAGDVVRTKLRLRQCLANACADGPPDILARLLGNFAGLGEQRDVALGRGEKLTPGIEHARPGAAGADINTEEMVGHGFAFDRLVGGVGSRQ